MKELPIRRFTTVVSYLTEPVSITKDGMAIGVFLPGDQYQKGQSELLMEQLTVDRLEMKEASMDNTAKKAIEPDRVKESRGKISKGLGDLPGEPKREAIKDSSFGHSRPAPKPGK